MLFYIGMSSTKQKDNKGYNRQKEMPIEHMHSLQFNDNLKGHKENAKISIVITQKCT